MNCLIRQYYSWPNKIKLIQKSKENLIQRPSKIKLLRLESSGAGKDAVKITQASKDVNSQDYDGSSYEDLMYEEEDISQVHFINLKL